VIWLRTHSYSALQLSSYAAVQPSWRDGSYCRYQGHQVKMRGVKLDVV